MSELVDAVDRAIEEKRSFDASTIKKKCSSFSELLQYFPKLFTLVDNMLFDGAVHQFMHTNDISFSIVGSTEGPAGLTTYDADTSQMKIHIRGEDAWKATFPALVGGELCSRADTCLIDVFLHEMLHVVLFSIYIDLDLKPKDIDDIVEHHYDSTHNVLFTVWLRVFFGQHTINNSLLLKSGNNKNPGNALVFKRNLLDTETQCLYNAKSKTTQKPIRLFYEGKYIPVKVIATFTTSNGLQPHHSRVKTENGQILVVPNGLLSC